MRSWVFLAMLSCAGTSDSKDEQDPLEGLFEQEDGTSTTNNDYVETSCIDGDYTERLPDPTADISDEIAAFSSNAPAAFLVSALEKRYPTGAVLLQGGMESEAFGIDCIQAFTTPTQRGSAAGMLEATSLLVHECGHFYDIELGGFTTAAYVITEDLTLTCGGGSMNSTPARSYINEDAWSADRPPCSTSGRPCDSYADIYLDGDPRDGGFDGGDQGLDTVIEEAVQYINSLASDWVMQDQRGAGTSISARDGILTFLWYIERYLAHMRVNTPGVYQTILDTPCWREAILTVWGRAWLYLDATSGISGLGIDDSAILTLVQTPELLEEIQRVRDAEGCP